MTYDEVQKMVEETVDLIAINPKSLADAKPRASRFLVVNALLTDFLKDIEEELPKHRTHENVQYAQATNIATGKNITEKKINVEAAPDYTTARENKEKLEALRDWVKTYIKIFENAHLMYRQFSRD